MTSEVMVSGRQSVDVDSGPDKSRKIFVTGASRSGTTMMSRILGQHHQVMATRELHYFGDLCKPGQLQLSRSVPELVQMAATLSARFQRGLWNCKIDDSDRDMARRLVASLPADQRNGMELFSTAMAIFLGEANKSIVCEQTPRNIFYAAQLLKAWPQSRFVHMVRDPRAVLASQKNRWRQRGMGRRNIPLTEVLRTRANYHPWTICRLWREATEKAIENSSHPNVMLVRFEDVVRDPDSRVREICDFLEIDFQETMLQIPQMGSSHKQNLSAAGITRDVVGRWRDVLDPGEIAWCEKANAVLMDRFNYVRESREKTGHTGFLSQLASYPLHLMGSIMANPRRVWIQLTAMLGARD